MKREGRVLVAVGICACLALAVGCGPKAKRKPTLYRLCGRVIDPETGKGLAQARLGLWALVPVPSGAQRLSAYGFGRTDGTYDLELGAGFEVMRDARRIRLEVSKPGYAPAAIDIPPPTAPKPFYRAPDLVLAKGRAQPAWSLKPPPNLPVDAPRPRLPPPEPAPRK